MLVMCSDEGLSTILAVHIIATPKDEFVRPSEILTVNPHVLGTLEATSENVYQSRQNQVEMPKHAQPREGLHCFGPGTLKMVHFMYLRSVRRRLDFS